MAKPKTVRQTKPKSAKQSAIVVLGMHRSGTSALSGVLSKLGCDTPKTDFTPTTKNEKGYFESEPLSDLLDRALKTANSSWSDWRPFNHKWMESIVAAPFIEEAVEVLNDEFPQSKLFVLKNPRLCRLIPFCTEILYAKNVTPFFVLTHRNPVEVAASLAVRDEFSPALAHLLWLRHVLDAEFATRGYPRYFTSYNAVLADWASEMTQLQDVLGVTFPKDIKQVQKEISAFLTPNLRHHTAPETIPMGDQDVSDWTRSVFAILQSWVGGSGKKADFKTLDEIRIHFNAMTLNFDGVIEDGLNLPKANSDAQGEIAKSRSEAKQARAELAKISAEAEKSSIQAADQVKSLNEAHAVAVAEIMALRATNEANTAEAAAQAKALEEAHADMLAEIQDRLSMTQSALAQRSHEAEQTHADLRVTLATLEQRNLDVERADAELAKVREDMGDRAREVDAKFKEYESEYETSLNAMKAQEEELRQTLELRFNELGMLGQLLVTSNAKQEEMAAAHAAERKTLQLNLSQMTAANQDQKVHLQNLTAKVQAADFEVHEMARSRSWTLTAPLRWMGKVVRKVIK